ncbi:MAG: cation transporter [Treponema sp.]|uniref:heavy-metal-associated domain-containing protein n=1 Tax=Treponema sp. TaxID=166 RepID=UPI001B5231F4|nr:heavy-metal-associated domain-containing protein [Treponema sp.]MBP5588614.1 cation transporter [Treponema sp.]MBR0155853.1 cation transporter [Treponema sp.]MCR5386178.1 heavy-metal-associated domain-containing protein [Treponema sp.]
MQKKIYVAGMFDDDSANKVGAAVSAVAGVTNCTANAQKAQVLVDFDESVAGIEGAINSAIEANGVQVLG